MQSNLFKELGIDDPAEFLLNTASYVDFAEANFRDPDDPSKPLKLEPGQRQVINTLQLGYDIESTPDHYINYQPPKGVVMIWPRQTGKTQGVVTFCCTAALNEPGCKIGVMAQSEPTAKEIIRRCKDIIKQAKFEDSVDKFFIMEIQFKNGSVIRAHPTSENIRGFSYHYLIIDEAALVEDKILREAALHTTRKIGKRWCLLSTPQGYKGHLVQYYRDGLRTRRIICKKCLQEYLQLEFENVKFDAKYMARGMPPCQECGHKEEDNTDIEGRSWGNTYFYGCGDYTVISVDPFKTSFYPKSEILAELERGGNSPKLRQELLGEIIPEGEGVFKAQWIESALDTSLKNMMAPDLNHDYIMGVDFGKVHDNSVIIVVHEDRESGKIILDYIRVILSRYHGKEYEDIKNEIIEVVLTFNPITIVPDATGMGEPIVEQMEKDLNRLNWYGKIYCNKSNRLGFWFDVKSKPDLIDNLQQHFARNRLKIPPKYEPDMDVLINELLNFSYEMTNTNYIKYGVQSDHDDTVIALALALWGCRYKPWIMPQVAFVKGSL